MKKNVLLLVFTLLLIPDLTLAGSMNDDPWLTMVIIDQLEIRNTDGSDPLVWDAEGWTGKDLHKLWLKSEGEYDDGRIEEAELQVLYSRAFAPFWDLQFGWRRDIRPTPDRDWLALGVKGLAPYFFDIDSTLFIGDRGRTAARLEAEYEIMLTQRLILAPEIELNLHGQDDAETGLGSGLTDIEAGLRLRYEIRRQFAPYIGLNWTRLYGDTADFARTAGDDIDDIQLVLGVRAWF